MPRRTWLIVLLVSALIAVGIGIGISLPRISRSDRTSNTALPGITLERLGTSEEMFALAGQDAVVLKYSGGDVDFWVEYESQGEKRTLFKVLGSSLRVENPDGPNQTVEGYLLFVLSEINEGHQPYRAASKRSVVSKKTSDVQVSTPVVEATASLSREDVLSRSEFCSGSIQVRGDGPVASSGQGSCPNLLPAEQEVCIKELRFKRKEKESDKEFVEVYTIKVMCKAVSAMESTAKSVLPAK